MLILEIPPVLQVTPDACKGCSGARYEKLASQYDRRAVSTGELQLGGYGIDD